MNKDKSVKENNKRTARPINVFDELCTFSPSKEQKKILNEFLDKNKRNIIFMPRVYGRNHFWKMFSKDKDMK